MVILSTRVILSYMKPNLPVICNHYNVRNLKFHLPLIKHEFAKQLLQYCLIKLLNEDENASQIAYKVGEQPFCTFKSVIKYKIISSYNNTCIDPENCVSCQGGNIDSVKGI